MSQDGVPVSQLQLFQMASVFLTQVSAGDYVVAVVVVVSEATDSSKSVLVCIHS